MDDVHDYEIEVRGRMDEGDLNAAGPLRVAVSRAEEGSSMLAVRTDQSGLIGLLRHLHGRGAVLTSVRSCDGSTPDSSP